ncbi:TadE/TadG family type IV pilus assembly protein [Alcaligenes sp. SDU_A2]|uniref:TadE/TadG family type IV pilus assembly protein n=1 Tax=Alcaligenes sp. SDU_A2 TaxID=3136634 RepID=UPI00311ED92E
MKRAASLSTLSVQRQRGVAAIEFALVLSLMLLVLGAVISFSSLFLAQQKITHLVGDAARQSATRALDAEQTAAFFQDYVAARAADDALLAWLGGLTPGFAQAACALEPTRQCGRFSLELNVQPWLLANLLDLLSPVLHEPQERVAPASLHAAALVVLGRGN